MLREWFTKIDGKEQGPFSRKELRYHKDLTPYTLVKKVGWDRWLPLCQVDELRDLFIEKEERDKAYASKYKGHGDILTLQLDPGHFFLYLLLALVILAYVTYLLMG